MIEKSRTIIIGLDGVPFGMLKDFACSGVMPHTANLLLSRAEFRKMHSSIPEVSSVAWSSIITGENPGEHGIFGFTDLHTHSYRLRFPKFSDLKALPFWEVWGGPSVIINVPATYPVRQMNGVHISGFVSIDFDKSVHPKSLIPRLKELDYRLDVDSQKAHSSIDLFLADLDKTLDARIKAYRYLWEAVDWQTFMLTFTGTDRLMHFLWDAYQDKSHKYHNLFLEHFAKIDRVIGEITSRLTDDDLLVMLSDHGFEALVKDVYVNYLLIEEGFLRFRKDDSNSLDNIDYGTKAFALDPARIYLNLKGKFPYGTVEPGQTEGLLSELESIFNDLELNGQKVIKNIYRKEQIFSGPYLDNAPDLVLVGGQGFNLKAKADAKQLTHKPIFTGKHTQDDAFLAIIGPSDKAFLPDTLAVWDVKRIIEQMRGEYWSLEL